MEKLSRTLGETGVLSSLQIKPPRCALACVIFLSIACGGRPGKHDIFIYKEGAGNLFRPVSVGSAVAPVALVVSFRSERGSLSPMSEQPRSAVVPV